MFKSKLIFIFVLLLIFITSCSTDQTYKIMSYNIRYDNKSDGLNGWDKRKEAIIEFLNYQKPHFLGIQEGLYHQVTYLDENLKDYKYIGIGREDGKNKGEFSAIFYNQNEFSLVFDSTIWLSENPQFVSTGWDAALERICTFGLFENKKYGDRFWIFNTHFDHIGELARENSSKLILSLINKLNDNDLPVVLMGDFNSLPDSKPMEIITSKLDDAYLISLNEPIGPLGTFTGFKIDAELKKRIDYIFVSDYQVLSLMHLNVRRDDGYFLSDHLPVLAEIKSSKY